MITQEIENPNQGVVDVFESFRLDYEKLAESNDITSGISKHKEDQFKDKDNEFFCSKEYLEYMQSTEHDGFPMSYDSIVFTHLAEKEPEIWSDMVKSHRFNIANHLGSNRAALSLCYPPNGFIGWHTNWNNPSYQLLFTWSETGDGYFRFQDNNTKEIITLQDKPGWNVRYHYFGASFEEDYLWHCAYTNCTRYSFAFTFASEKVDPYHVAQSKKEAKLLFDMAVEEIAG